MKKAQKETLVSFILDETGSMGSIEEATISGFNEYLQTLRKSKDKISMTLTKFNSEKTEIVFNGKPIKDVPELSHDTYHPNHNTPLFDAIGKTINALSKTAKDKNVLITILTDGQENASTEFNWQKIQQLIKEKQEKGWTFTFLGANQDSWHTGQMLGIPTGNSINFSTTASSTRMAFSAMANTTMDFASTTANTSNMFVMNASVEDYELQTKKKAKTKGSGLGQPQTSATQFNSSNTSSTQT